MSSNKITFEFPGPGIEARPLASSLGSWNHTTSPMGRPMTEVVQARAVTLGYRSSLTYGSSVDLLGQSRSRFPSIESNSEDMTEEIIILEKKVKDLIEESCMAKSTGDLQLALEKAKESGRNERVLANLREESGSWNINVVLTCSVLLNLANQYENNEMYTEALNTYQLIVKDKRFINGGILRVNMANIYFKKKNYTKAIKFYQMALDTISNDHKIMRMKIMQNIAMVFVHIGQYSGAITSLEHIMTESPNIRTGFNLVLCFYAIGDSERMKKAFQNLISVPLGIINKDKFIPSDDDNSANTAIEGTKKDKLHHMERNVNALALKYIITAAKLIAPVIETSLATGLDWCMDLVKSSQYSEAANDLEITKIINSLRKKDFNLHVVVETLKTLVRKDSSVKIAAATNLSSLYFLKTDYEQAKQYSDSAMNADSTNPTVLVNKGNTEFVKQEYKKATEFYKEALRSDSSSTEALYNLGLSNKKLNCLEESLDCFLKLHAILRNNAQVMYQLAHLYELLENPKEAIKWLMQVISLTPTDPKVLAKLGELYDHEGDMPQALQYYYESFRCFPSNIDVIKWLGTYYYKNQFFEKAIQHFQRASLIEPTHVQWQLLVASCYRKSGNYQKALDKYRDIHHRFPQNVQCLHFLVRLCADMKLKEGREYTTTLKKVVKMKETRELLKGSTENSLMGRPKMGAKKRAEDVTFTDLELRDDLLPE
ncbi:intraflagellar transport protein 88-like isoform X1 [Solea senegalensis]|uniref:Intraflagellar transport protein 88-like isoform X1 n=1 Tax=Solea senegalensis TaxID=28829 RepID=A0AAV6SDB9_SOLSE|nr:intraflagellar transport protein 88 homolog [Solea senegalensis]KAG7514815.1 intraflagellar transport protein 88-like isoform X1 [Solea senegalensis]